MTRRIRFQAVEIVQDATASFVKTLRSVRQRKLSSRAMEKSRAEAFF
jgi:hypothetical protein